MQCNDVGATDQNKEGLCFPEENKALDVFLLSAIIASVKFAKFISPVSFL